MLWATKAILKWLAHVKDDDDSDRRLFVDDVDPAIRLVIQSPGLARYSLSQKAVNDLALCRPISTEVLDAYIRLIPTQRCLTQDFDEDRIQFHFFD